MHTPRTRPLFVSNPLVPNATRRPARRRWLPRTAATVVLLAASLLSFGLPASATRGAVNVAVALDDSIEGQPVNDFSWDLERVSGVDAIARNRAVAISGATRATAMAWQILLDSDAGQRIDATNYALGDGRECPSCDTTAIAYQFVVTSDKGIEFSPETATTMAVLRDRAEALSRSNAPSWVLEAGAAALARDIQRVLDSLTAVRPTARSLTERSTPPRVLVRHMVDHH